MYRYLLLICLLAGCCFTAMAQKTDTLSSSPAAKVKSKADSLKLKADSIRLKKQDTTVATTYTPKIKKEKVFHPDTNHSPHTAVIRSLIIPGLGQAYNHRWWKIPVIYGACGRWQFFQLSCPFCRNLIMQFSLLQFICDSA